jgi:hypothetical protein
MPDDRRPHAMRCGGSRQPFDRLAPVTRQRPPRIDTGTDRGAVMSQVNVHLVASYGL